MQTSIIIQATDEHEILVRLHGCHVSTNDIDVDWRLRGTMSSQSWYPMSGDRLEFRHEGGSTVPATQRGRDLDFLAELLRQAEFHDVLVEPEVAAGLEAIDRLRAERE